jgi:hypothetical protein
VVAEAYAEKTIQVLTAVEHGGAGRPNLVALGEERSPGLPEGVAGGNLWRAGLISLEGEAAVSDHQAGAASDR